MDAESRQAAEHYLEKSIGKTLCQDWTLEQIYRQLVMGGWELYLVKTQEQDIVGAGVVALQEVGQRRLLEVVFFGSDDHLRTWESVLKSLKDVAKRFGCSAIRFEGRPGWEKVLNAKRVNLFEVEV